MKAMVLKEICEIKIEGKIQKKTYTLRKNIPVKAEPLKLTNLSVPKT